MVRELGCSNPLLLLALPSQVEEVTFINALKDADKLAVLQQRLEDGACSGGGMGGEGRVQHGRLCLSLSSAQPANKGLGALVLGFHSLHARSDCSNAPVTGGNARCKGIIHRKHSIPVHELQVSSAARALLPQYWPSSRRRR